MLDFDQTIPKPFCIQSPLDWLIVKGPIDFDQQVVVSGSGNFVSRFHAKGRLELIPVNVLTRETDESLEARVMEQDHNVVTDRVTLVSTLQMQVIFGNGPDSGRLMATLNVGPGASDHAGLEITCGS